MDRRGEPGHNARVPSLVEPLTCAGRHVEPRQPAGALAVARGRGSLAASPEDVWAVLTDTAAWPQWVEDVSRVDGRIATGGRLLTHSRESGRRAFPLRVEAVDAPHRVELDGGLPLGLYRGSRTFTLTPTPTGTRFRIREEHRGALLRLHPAPDLQPWFDGFAARLKRRVEGP